MNTHLFKSSNKILLFLLLILSIILIASCSKVECRKDVQCAEKACHIATCQANVCVYQPIPSCCGNLMCEKDETRCTCASDCKPLCKGSVILETTAYKNITSEYLDYQCNVKTQACDVVVKSGKAKQSTLLEEKKTIDLNLDMTLKYNQPFDVTKDEMEITVSLDYIGKRIKLPIVLRKIEILSGQELLGSKTINEPLMETGAFKTIKVPITAQLTKREESKIIKVKVDYDSRIFKGDEILEQMRDTIEKQFSQKVIFVETGEDEAEK